MMMKSGAEAPTIFWTIENGQSFPPINSWQMMFFLNPLGAQIPKIPPTPVHPSGTHIITEAQVCNAPFSRPKTSINHP